MHDENDQGREIVLGNKQLLSMFFIVAALLGVAFTMGYIIGRNTTGVSAASNTTTVAPPAVNKTTATDEPETDTAAPPVARTESNPTTPTAAPVGVTQPAKPYAGNTAPIPAPAPVTPAASDDKKPASSDKVAAGSYLQVAALKRQDADHLVDVLIKRGYPALLGESPKEGLFRVLVGPFKDMAALADSKQRLKAAGIDSIVAR